jgi:hypothetical protein
MKAIIDDGLAKAQERACVDEREKEAVALGAATVAGMWGDGGDEGVNAALVLMEQIKDVPADLQPVWLAALEDAVGAVVRASRGEEERGVAEQIEKATRAMKAELLVKYVAETKPAVTMSC